MKAHRILLFFISVIVLLGLLCRFFPAEGVRIAGVDLDFPTLEEFFAVEEEDEQESPEELLARRMEAVRRAEAENLLDYFSTDPARIYFPGDSISSFDPFFKSLDDASDTLIRIAHYGDSQIEEDRISKVLRDSLQTRFGGGGPGMIPVREEYYTYSISEAGTVTPDRFMVFGPPEVRAGNNRYGPMGQKSHYDSLCTVSIHPIKTNLGPSRYFNRLTLLSSGGVAVVSCKGITQILESSDTIRHIRFSLPDSTSRISFSFSGYQDIYGVMLDNDKGVSLDNIPMRGCSGTIFTAIAASQLKDYFEKDNVRLIILQYGGNMVPFTSKEKDISAYKSKIEKQILYLKELAPDASILFIGPSDMSTSIQGKMQTYPQLPMLVDSLKAAATNSGAAFWDMYSAMGGQGSMKKWVEQDPPLAGSDYVHFTPAGAEKVGGMLYESLMLYYKYYQLRKK